jgi:hypothetical protein
VNKTAAISGRFVLRYARAVLVHRALAHAARALRLAAAPSCSAAKNVAAIACIREARLGKSV